MKKIEGLVGYLGKHPVRQFFIDKDGTMVSTTLATIHSIFDHLCIRHGIPPTDENVVAFWYSPRRSGLLEHDFGVNAAVFWKEFNDETSPEKRNVDAGVYPGVLEFLQTVGRRNVYRDLVTASSSSHTHQVIEMLGLRSHIDGLVCLDDMYIQLDGGPPENVHWKAYKPDPRALLHMLLLRDLMPENAVGIGNDPNDMLFYKKAHLRALLVDHGEYPFDTADFDSYSVEEGKDFLRTSFPELERVISDNPKLCTMPKITGRSPYLLLP